MSTSVGAAKKGVQTFKIRVQIFKKGVQTFKIRVQIFKKRVQIKFLPERGAPFGRSCFFMHFPCFFICFSYVLSDSQQWIANFTDINSDVDCSESIEKNFKPVIYCFPEKQRYRI